MNHIQENHQIRVYNSYISRSSFTGLWTTLARQQHFLRLRLSLAHGSSSVSQEEIKQAIQEQTGQLSPYSSRIMEKYHVIYHKDNTIIVTNVTPLLSLGTLFAIEDADAPNRYFIAFAFPVGGTMEYITGYMVYFPPNGACYSDHTIICESILASYDTRNGLIRSSHVFMYHQTLLFTQIVQNTRKLQLFINYIPYHTDIIQDHASYYTSYMVQSQTEKITQFKRFLYIPLELDKNLFIDLGSLAVIEEKHLYSTLSHQVQYYFQLNTYIILKSGSVIKFLDTAKVISEIEYSDGYPIYCIKCQAPLVAATYRYRSAHLSICSGLGSGYCPTCHIRYSFTKKEWVCSEIKLDGTICNGYFMDNLCCSASFHSEDQSVLQLHMETLLKYPYRDKVSIQWMPSENAKVCADIARTCIGADYYVSDTPPLKVDEDI